MLTSICSNAACWDATGSMLQGWGAWFAGFAVIYAAWKAGDALSNFRRQKQEERRIDAAQQLLTFAYRFKRTLRSARITPASALEETRAGELLKQTLEDWDSKHEEERQRHLTAQIISSRLNSEEVLHNGVFDLMPVARALFGDEVESHLQALWEARTSVELDAHLAITVKPAPIRHRDAIEESVAEAIKGLEGVLLPVIRADYSAPRKA
jgi:hypothetical protein